MKERMNKGERVGMKEGGDEGRKGDRKEVRKEGMREGRNEERRKEEREGKKERSINSVIEQMFLNWLILFFFGLVTSFNSVLFFFLLVHTIFSCIEIDKKIKRKL